MKAPYISTLQWHARNSRQREVGLVPHGVIDSRTGECMMADNTWDAAFASKVVRAFNRAWLDGKEEARKVITGFSEAHSSSAQTVATCEILSSALDDERFRSTTCPCSSTDLYECTKIRGCCSCSCHNKRKP